MKLEELSSGISQKNQRDHAPRQLPEGYLFPGANPRQCLTPENAYTLEDFDILVGLDWIRSKTRPPQHDDPIRYFLMPICFRWVFEKNSTRPQVDSDYKQMQHSLNCLLKDAVENSKIPVIIAGILNLDKNHYINYFCAWNPKQKQIALFILDPSAEKEAGSKKVKELHYAEIIREMLIKTFQNIHCDSFSVTQQLREKDCGFLCLQNLEDLFIRLKLAMLSQDGMVNFDLKGLTVYGNPGRKYDEHQKMYAYRAQILDQDLSVRACWASRMMGEPSAPVTAFRLLPLKDNPTLNDAIESEFKLEPYDYSANVKRQFDNDILGQARSTICALFTEMRVRGVNVLDACVAQYNNDFVLPSESDIAEYTKHLRSCIKPIEVQGRVYTVQDLDLEFGSLEYVVQDSIMELLHPHHGSALLVRLGPFLKTYQWERALAWKAKVLDDFFASENIQHIVRLLKPGELSKIKETCTEFYKEDLDQRFIQFIQALKPKLLRDIGDSEEANSLYQIMQEYCHFSVGYNFRRAALDFQSRLREAILLQVRAELTHIVPVMVLQSKKSLFAEKVPLIERLRMRPSRWHSLINANPLWHDFVKHFPNVTKPFLEQIDQQLEAFILALLDQKIHEFIVHQSYARLSQVGTRHSPRDLQWQAFSRDILDLEAGVEVPAAHQEYYIKRLVALTYTEMERLQNTERHFIAVIRHIQTLCSVCADKVQGFDEFYAYLSAVQNQIETVKAQRNTKSFKSWLVDSQKTCLSRLNPLLTNLAQHFEPGCTDPHHITYVLRPILARLFNVSIQTGHRSDFYIIYDIEEMTRADLPIVHCLTRGLRDFPATIDSDLLILPSLATVNYEGIEQLQAAHLLSMIHSIDSDFYKANSFSFWFSYLKPLRNALIEVLGKLRLGPHGSVIPIPKETFEPFKDLLNAAYNASLVNDNSPANHALIQLLTVLRRQAGIDQVDEDLERDELNRL